MRKQQVWVIHGGMTFDTYEEYLDYLQAKEVDLDSLFARGWKASLQEDLGEEYSLIGPRMPNANNAKYEEWKIWFGKLVSLMDNGAIMLGHSLGGIFLAKYLAEENIPVALRATFLIAAPYDSAGSDESLGDFVLPGSLDKLQEQGGVITLYHSEDDPVVPFAQMEKYRASLPGARVRVFADRLHFNQEFFPELAEDIRAVTVPLTSA